MMFRDESIIARAKQVLDLEEFSKAKLTKRFLSTETIEKAIKEQIYGTDLVVGPARWGLGWALPSKEEPITPNWETRRACMWGGVGGSAILMDLDAKLCSTYAMNKMGAPFPPWRDPRTWKLNKILYECLGEEM